MELHHAVSVIGGFWGGYTIFNHCDIFANAQTGNFARMAMSLAIAGAAGDGVTIENPECVDISYPEFYKTLAGL